jgi:DNA (cytosine-5)-methyltransferase 1
MKPRLLDLFCGAGGAAMGYSRAGFGVVGVDIHPQPNYPFEFVQADALGFLIDAGHDRFRFGPFDAIHASPPCQAFTSMQAVARNADAHEDLLEPTRRLLEQTGLPYIIENVPGAPLIEPFTLCGTMFPGHQLHVGNDARELHRHRLFETNWDVGLLPQCLHRWKAAGVYGDHLRMGRRSSQGEFSGAVALELGSKVMGIDWMTWPELTQAIPPSYTQWIGTQLVWHLDRVAA